MSDEPEIITRIERIDDAGYFKNWKWTEGCAQMRPTTVVYGSNGSGKSTLASALASLRGVSGVQLVTSAGRRVAGAADDPLWRRV